MTGGNDGVCLTSCYLLTATEGSTHPIYFDAEGGSVQCPNCATNRKVFLAFTNDDVNIDTNEEWTSFYPTSS